MLEKKYKFYENYIENYEKGKIISSFNIAREELATILYLNRDLEDEDRDRNLKKMSLEEDEDKWSKKPVDEIYNLNDQDKEDYKLKIKKNVSRRELMDVLSSWLGEKVDMDKEITAGELYEILTLVL